MNFYAGQIGTMVAPEFKDYESQALVMVGIYTIYSLFDSSSSVCSIHHSLNFY